MIQVVRAHIIVDASVARSVGEPARHPAAIACLRFARALEKRSCDSGVLMTPSIRQEWRKHASSTMTKWLVAMEQKKRLRSEDDKPVRDLREKVEQIEDEGIKAAIAKDLLLSEAAILNRCPVASLDEKQRRYLRELDSAASTLRNVQWFNPIADQDWETWVIEGCQETSVYLLIDEVAS